MPTDLSSFLSSQPLTWLQKFNIMKEMTSSLLRLHQQNIIHCDICPQTISIGDGNNVKLSNFSSYTKVEEGEVLPEQMEREKYIAPEVKESGCSLSSDIYALGQIFHDILENEDKESERKYKDICLVFECEKEPTKRPKAEEIIQAIDKAILYGKSSFQL